MGLTALEPPTATADTACRYVAALRSGSGFLTRGALSRRGERIWLTAPHPVFNLRLDDLGTRAPLTRVQMTGWRYLVVSHDAALATVELAATSRSDVASFCRITDGWMATSIADAVKRAERNATVRRRHYVLSMVRVPSIHMNAVWFRDVQADGAHDLFQVLDPSSVGSAKNRLLAHQGFLGLLRECKVRSAQRPTEV